MCNKTAYTKDNSIIKNTKQLYKKSHIKKVNTNTKNIMTTEYDGNTKIITRNCGESVETITIERTSNKGIKQTFIKNDGNIKITENDTNGKLIYYYEKNPNGDEYESTPSFIKRKSGITQAQYIKYYKNGKQTKEIIKDSELYQETNFIYDKDGNLQKTISIKTME